MTHIKNQQGLMGLTIITSILLSILFFSGLYLHAKQKKTTRLTAIVNYHNRMIKEGSISSLVTLGEMYERGDGVKKDLLKAQELFKKAINYGQVNITSYETSSALSNKHTLTEKIKLPKSSKKTANIGNQYFNQNNASYFTKTNLNQKTVTKKQKSSSAKKINQKIKLKKTTPTHKTKPAKPQQQKNINRKIKPLPKGITNDTRVTKLNHAKVVNKSYVSIKINKNIVKTNSTTSNKGIKKFKKIKPLTFKNNSDNKLATKVKPNIIYRKKNQAIIYKNEYEDELNEYDESDEPVIEISDNNDELVTNQNNFTSNPCYTSSARYIPKCRRLKRK